MSQSNHSYATVRADTRDDDPLYQALHQVLEQCRTVLEACGSDAFYAAQDGGHSGIGPHMRHVLEHFDVFLKALDTGLVDYEARARDKRLETSVEAADEAINALRDCVEQTCFSRLDQSLTVRESPMADLTQVEFQSTIGREWLFLIHHTVHHLALIKNLARHKGVELPAHLGVAAATLQYERSQAQAG